MIVPKYQYGKNITEPEKETIQEITTKNLQHKMSAYIKKLTADSPDAELACTVNITKNSKKQFNGIVMMTGSSLTNPLRYTREGFDNVRDLINHAFDRFKEELASR
jgi:hypothetical protein